MTMFLKQLMLILLLLGFSLPAFVLAEEPTEQITQTTDKVLAIVQDPALKGEGKDAEREAKIKKVIDERFDWGAMARSALGKHWRDLSEAQRTEFTSLFSELVKMNYMSKVESYSGEKFLYKGDKVDGKYGVVEVVIVTLRGSNIPVSYRVLKQGTEWLVYDIIIEGISLVNNYRSQIADILNRSSYANLIERLKVKIDLSNSQQGERKTGSTTDKKKEEADL